ncbi:MAG: carbohydrate ABC transporter permease [Phycisphaerae bacterium]|nr:carbohydrate ABC transporter permease [Phycisphaerae bacterium]
MSRKPTHLKQRWRHGASYLFLGVVGVGMLIPLLWMIVTSLRSPDSDIMDYSSLFPAPQPTLAQRDVRSPELLVRALVKEGRANPSSQAGRIWSRLGEKDREELATMAKTGGELDFFQAEALLEILNVLLGDPELYSPKVFPYPTLPADAQAILRDADAVGDACSRDKLAQLSKEDLGRLNRRLFETVFPERIAPAGSVTLENYKVVLTETNFGRALFNSVLVTVCVTFGQLVTSSLAAFAFARLTFFGRDKIFLAYLATMMIPVSVTMIPTFILLRHLGWIDTYAALILPAAFTVYGTFLLRQFFMGLPVELEEAAVLDGCGTLRIYWHVALPLSKPAMAALAILTIMGSWRTFMWPLIVAQTPEHFTLPVALTKFQGIFGTEWTFLMAGGVIMIVPMLLIFFFGQRFFVSGLRVGAVKG